MTTRHAALVILSRNGCPRMPFPNFGGANSKDLAHLLRAISF